MQVRPRVILQLALNMPDHSSVRNEGILLDCRRRRAYFHALEGKNKKDPSKMTAYERAKHKATLQAVNRGADEFQKLHPDAMEWKKARAWLR